MIFMTTGEGNVRLKPKAVNILLDDIASSLDLKYHTMERKGNGKLTIPEHPIQSTSKYLVIDMNTTGHVAVVSNGRQARYGN